MSDLFSIDVDGLESFERAAEVLENGFDWDRVLDEGAALLLNHIRTRYIQALDPDNNPWPESAAARTRAEKGIGGLTGYDTGHLFRSLQLFKSGDFERTIGTDVEYAAFFQWGPPQRIYMTANDDDIYALEKLFLTRWSEVLNA